MSKAKFSDDFKRDAVVQITERGYPVAEVSQRLGVSPHSYSLRNKGESRRTFSMRRRRLRICVASIRFRPPQAVQSPPAKYPNVRRRLKRIAVGDARGGRCHIK